MASSAWAVKLLAAVGADLRGASFSLELRAFANYCTKKQITTTATARAASKPASELPWGRKQGLTFQLFTRRFFSMCPRGRSTAADLLMDKFLTFIS